MRKKDARSMRCIGGAHSNPKLMAGGLGDGQRYRAHSPPSIQLSLLFLLLYILYSMFILFSISILPTIYLFYSILPRLFNNPQYVCYTPSSPFYTPSSLFYTLHSMIFPPSTLHSLLSGLHSLIFTLSSSLLSSHPMHSILHCPFSTSSYSLLL